MDSTDGRVRKPTRDRTLHRRTVRSAVDSTNHSRRPFQQCVYRTRVNVQKIYRLRIFCWTFVQTPSVFEKVRLVRRLKKHTAFQFRQARQREQDSAVRLVDWLSSTAVTQYAADVLQRPVVTSFRLDWSTAKTPWMAHQHPRACSLGKSGICTLYTLTTFTRWGPTPD